MANTLNEKLKEESQKYIIDYLIDTLTQISDLAHGRIKRLSQVMAEVDANRPHEVKCRLQGK